MTRAALKELRTVAFISSPYAVDEATFSVVVYKRGRRGVKAFNLTFARALDWSRYYENSKVEEEK